MNNEQSYLRSLRFVARGRRRNDRTGVGTRSRFSVHSKYDLRQSFPALTTKKIHFSSVVKELLWFLSGSTNVNDLDCGIWDEWADDTGDLGPTYGEQWRSWSTRYGQSIDQIATVIESIKTNPNSRRHIVTAWNPGDLDQQALPPCHVLFQFYVRGDNLDCHLYQRSGDMFLGVPFNIASYALLTHMISQVCDLDPGFFHHTIGDAHVYENHTSQVATQLDREPLDPPLLKLNEDITDIDDFTADDIELVGYEHHPAIPAPVAV